jgi:hypothetical protein
MVAFLFWNLNRRPLSEAIANIVARHHIDVVILCECCVTPVDLLRSLNVGAETSYRYAPGIGCKRVEILARFPGEFIRPVYETDRLSVRHIVLPGAMDILLAAVHFPSKLHWRDNSQVLECVELADQIRDVERHVGHSRTVLVGDLNMNPFEEGVVGAKGLHGVMTRRIATTGSRVVQGRQYPFFYNPMWGLFGDRWDSPPGTYYRSASEQTVFFWNMFDQVLIRPELLSCFDQHSVEVVQSDGQMSLLSPEGTPDTEVASDHLPLVFQLRL